MNQYVINYESLVFNLPISKPYELMDHTFLINQLPKENEDRIASKEFPLMVNLSFVSCCYTFDGNLVNYVTMRNNTSLIMELDDPKSSHSMNKVIDDVERTVKRIEHYLLFITNTHIFFPVISISICDTEGKEVASCIQCPNQPIAYQRWSEEHQHINLSRRSGTHIDFDLFEVFLKRKKRYSMAFDYYIKSFYETNHASAFCMLCASIDAVTGKSGSNMTKQRLARYSSVLFCTPLSTASEESKMKHFYKLRSNFVHGKGCLITKNDEICLREYVRKFLCAYYLFWQELKVKNEQQMLQHLDAIYEDHSLYMKLVPVSYSFIALLDEHERRTDGILDLPMEEKYCLVIRKMAETLFNFPASSLNGNGTDNK